MYKSLELFQTSAAMARHAGQRQALVARNIANADTPGYQAMRIAAFRDTYRDGATTRMKSSRPGHLGTSGGGAAMARITSAGTEAAPNGNTVSLEEEMLAAVEVSREHNRALAIYRHTMTVLRTSLGK